MAISMESEGQYTPQEESDSDSDTDGSLCEEVVEEEGEREVILVQRKEGIDQTPSCGSSQPSSVGFISPSNPAVDYLGMASSRFFLDCVSSLLAEDLIQRSPKGKRVGEILTCIERMDEKEVAVAGIANHLTSAIHYCLDAGRRKKLPSAAQSTVWATFHMIRSSEHVKNAWLVFTAGFPSPVLEFALQMLLDRMLKRMISNKAKMVADQFQTSLRFVKPFTTCETRYMAGYVAVHLLKRFKKPRKNDKLKLKRQLFVQVLKEMRAQNQPAGEPESIHEYTTQWTELIDRGGLFQISDEVYLLILKIESIFRKHFNEPCIKSYASGKDLRRIVLDEVLECEPILSRWENLATGIPAKYASYSIELLEAITDLWITVRGHAFAKGWTMKFQKKYKRKGTRKELQPQRDDETLS